MASIIVGSPILTYEEQDSDTNPNTTATSDAEGVFQPDGRKRRIEATNLRKSVFGKKHNRLDESKVDCCIAKRMELSRLLIGSTQ